MSLRLSRSHIPLSYGTVARQSRIDLVVHMECHRLQGNNLFEIRHVSTIHINEDGHSVATDHNYPCPYHTCIAKEHSYGEEDKPQRRRNSGCAVNRMPNG